MCMFIVRYQREFSRLHKFTPLVLELSYMVSSPLGRMQRIFCNYSTIHNSPIFVPPGTHHPITIRWTEAVWNEKFARYFYA